MPKKQQTKKTEEDELSELMQESLKKSRERLRKESSEQGFVEEGEETPSDSDLGALEFHQFLNPVDSTGVPVLERIAGSGPRPIFVGGIQRGASAEDENDGKDLYVPGRGNNNEPKYAESSAQIYMESQSADITRIGKTRDTIAQANRETSFQQAPELRQFGSESVSPERTWSAERIDIERAGRADPFERPEAKYEKYKPKYPK